MIRKITFLLILMQVAFLGTVSAAEYVYYADQFNPPTTEREPPFNITRKKVGGTFGYLHIRYPSQKASGSTTGDFPFTMRVSVGNGLLKEAPIFFQFTKLAIIHDEKSLELIPSFYNEIIAKRETGMKALLDYRHEAPSHLHRRVDIICTGCRSEHQKILLEIEVIIDYLHESKTIREVIPLYQGRYSS